MLFKRQCSITGVSTGPTILIASVSEVTTRSALVNGLKPDIIRCINELLHDTNHYVEIFKVAKEILNKKVHPPTLKLLLMRPKGPWVNTLRGIIDLLVMR